MHMTVLYQSMKSVGISTQTNSKYICIKITQMNVWINIWNKFAPRYWQFIWWQRNLEFLFVRTLAALDSATWFLICRCDNLFTFFTFFTIFSVFTVNIILDKAFDFVCLAGSVENRLVEWVDHLHQHFKCPPKVENGRYILLLIILKQEKYLKTVQSTCGWVQVCDSTGCRLQHWVCGRIIGRPHLPHWKVRSIYSNWSTIYYLHNYPTGRSVLAIFTQIEPIWSSSYHTCDTSHPPDWKVISHNWIQLFHPITYQLKSKLIISSFWKVKQRQRSGPDCLCIWIPVFE